eukprot:g5671.t1
MSAARFALVLCLSSSALSAPCDIYRDGGTPCAAAHSTVRALFKGFTGALYQLQRSPDNATADIHAQGGLADSGSHDRFCAGASELSPRILAGYPPRAACVISKIYDQTGNENHLLVAGPAVSNPAYDNPVNASRHPIRIAGRKAYGAYFETGMGYRARGTKQVARGNEEETVYMLTSGVHTNAECCFDYGNAEQDCNNRTAYCDGCMEAVYFGNGYGGQGKGNWIGVDMENGIYGGEFVNASFLNAEFVVAMGKGGAHSFATKGSDGTRGALTTLHDGARPAGYQPMHKTGAIVLGMGGDNYNRAKRDAGAGADVGVPAGSVGTFYEGIMTAGYTTDAADDAVQADIVAAGYGK